MPARLVTALFVPRAIQEKLSTHGLLHNEVLFLDFRYPWAPEEEPAAGKGDGKGGDKGGDKKKKK